MKIKLPVFLLGVLAVPLLFGYCSLGGGGSAAPDPVYPPPYDPLSPATTTGANTWGCFVDTDQWADDSWEGDSTTVHARWVSPDTLTITLQHLWDPEQAAYKHRIEFTLLDTTHSYAQSIDNYNFHSYLPPWQPIQTNFVTFYSIETGGSCTRPNGNIRISYLNRQQGIVSGTFNIYLPNCAFHQLSSGRFDIGNMTR